MRDHYSDAVLLSIAAAIALFTLDSVFDLGIIPDPLRDLERVEVVEEYTFKDVRPIFENRCTSCHSAPHWNWTDYQNAYRKRDAIRSRVWATRSMPLGQSMPEEERAIVRDWVDGGAKE